MNIRAIKTHRIGLHESLYTIAELYFSALPEKAIVALSSKVVSFCQGRVMDKSVVNKQSLVAREADASLPGSFLAIKNNRLMPYAGIDESNGNGAYVLHPQEGQKTAAALWQYLRTRYQRTHCGIILTDSTIAPCRRGVTGICLGWCGFEPLYSYRGQCDLYGRSLQMTNINLLDSLATAATLVMGEGQEQTPCAIIEHVPRILFLDRPPSKEEEDSVVMPLEDDMYYPFLTHYTNAPA